MYNRFLIEKLTVTQRTYFIEFFTVVTKVCRWTLPFATGMQTSSRFTTSLQRSIDVLCLWPAAGIEPVKTGLFSSYFRTKRLFTSFTCFKGQRRFCISPIQGIQTHVCVCVSVSRARHIVQDYKKKSIMLIGGWK